MPNGKKPMRKQAVFTQSNETDGSSSNRMHSIPGCKNFRPVDLVLLLFVDMQKKES